MPSANEHFQFDLVFALNLGQLFNDGVNISVLTAQMEILQELELFAF